MIPTAYEWGHKSPSDHFPPDPRVKIQGRDAIKVQRGASPAERERRLRIALAARQRFPSTEAMGRAVGVSGGSVGKWLTGQDQVPEKYMGTLEHYAGGSA